MPASRKFGSLLALGALLLVIAGTLCPLSAQEMNAKQMACCASKPCQQSTQNEDCCTKAGTNGQQFKAELTKTLYRPLFVPAMHVTSSMPTMYRSPARVEAATLEHAPPLPLYTVNHSFLI